MKRSTDRILTTHAGELTGPAEYEAMDLIVRSGQPYDEARYADVVRRAIRESVKRQSDLGLSIISDGEHGKSRGYRYYSQRVSGLSQRPLRQGEFSITIRKTREREEYKDFYQYLEETDKLARPSVPPGTRCVCTGPLRHTSVAALQTELDAFKAALDGVKVEEAFFPVLAPGWLDHFIFNEYYPTDEDFIFALAEALRPEYEAIVNAGFLLQIDDPGLADAWPTFFPEPALADYRKYAKVRIDALNVALAGIPEDRIRYHLCWGSQHGPHVNDLPLASIIDLMLSVRAQAYSLEAANPRHEHEWKIWRDVKLPKGKILIPGVVSHATNTIEHEELIADRIVRFADIVGRENVIAGTDCGMGRRTHPQIGWGKLKALVAGANIASQRLWNAAETKPKTAAAG